VSQSRDVIVSDVIRSNAYSKSRACDRVTVGNQLMCAKSPTSTTTTTATVTNAEDLSEDDRVTINVSGLRFETRRSTLARHPGTLLGNARRRRHHYDSARGEYFFERGRHTFDALLYYYQSGGHLHRPVSVPLDVFVDDLRFYQLDENIIEKCCANEGVFRQKPPPLPKNKFQRKVRSGAGRNLIVKGHKEIFYCASPLFRGAPT